MPPLVPRACVILNFKMRNKGSDLGFPGFCCCCYTQDPYTANTHLFKKKTKTHIWFLFCFGSLFITLQRSPTPHFSKSRFYRNTVTFRKGERGRPSRRLPGSTPRRVAGRGRGMEVARARLYPWLRGEEQSRPRRLGPGSGSPHRRAAQGQSQSPGSPSGPSTGPGRTGHSPGRAAPGMPALLPAGGAGSGRPELPERLPQASSGSPEKRPHRRSPRQPPPNRPEPRAPIKRLLIGPAAGPETANGNAGDREAGRGGRGRRERWGRQGPGPVPGVGVCAMD